MAPGFGEIAENLDFSGHFGPKSLKNILKSLVRNRNSPDILTVNFYERHLWAGLLGWPD
jgi:hypothetical protein